MTEDNLNLRAHGLAGFIPLFLIPQHPVANVHAISWKEPTAGSNQRASTDSEQCPEESKRRIDRENTRGRKLRGARVCQPESNVPKNIIR